jgi:hypothetical protein
MKGPYGYSYKVPKKAHLKTVTVKPAGVRGKAGVRGEPGRLSLGLERVDAVGGGAVMKFTGIHSPAEAYEGRRNCILY